MATPLDTKKEICRAAFARARAVIPKLITPFGGTDTYIIWRNVRGHIDELCLNRRLNEADTLEITRLVDSFFNKLVRDKVIISFEADKSLPRHGFFGGPGYYSSNLQRFD